MQKKKTRFTLFGFSLLEILITFSVLGALALTSSIFFKSKITQARDLQRKVEVNKIKHALEEYYDTLGNYPDKLPDCNQPFNLAKSSLIFSTPCDPITKNGYAYVSDGTKFTLYTKLELPNDSDIKKLGCDLGCGPNCGYNYGVSSTNTAIVKCQPVLPTPTSTPPIPQIIYACAVGGGTEGHCAQFDDPVRSLCPKIYINDPSCKNECSNKSYRCKNDSGKHVP